MKKIIFTLLFSVSTILAGYTLVYSADCKSLDAMGLHPTSRTDCMKQLSSLQCFGASNWVWKSKEDLDFEENLLSYKSRAEHGDVSAQLILGRYYGDGILTKLDSAESFKWYRMAAEQGEASAQLQLGFVYDMTHGINSNRVDGVQKKYEDAAKWYRKAAEQGNITAQRHLGSLYFNGHGVKKNYEEAYFWYALSNHPPMVILIGRDYLTPKQFMATIKRIREWKPTK